MKEIGGYFGLEDITGQEYYAHLVAVNNGRNGLAYLLRARNIRKLYIPRFLCDSVSGVCDREGYHYKHYPIDQNMMPVFDRNLNEGEWLYVVNFYGRLDNKTVVALKERYEKIIFDNVQAFFQLPVPGVDTLYSCRKFFGVPDGGYVSTDSVYPEELPMDKSAGRMKHVLGRYEDAFASEHYAEFKENDHSFAELKLRSMSALTHNLLRAVDYEAVKCRREDNYATLGRLLDGTNPLSPCHPVGPYAYPYYCKNGMTVKKKLAEQKIFVATLWPNVLNGENGIEKDFAENILPLPCDQRYGREDMERIAKTIQHIKEEI